VYHYLLGAEVDAIDPLQQFSLPAIGVRNQLRNPGSRDARAARATSQFS
jgi:hypothetical protein